MVKEIMKNLSLNLLALLLIAFLSSCQKENKGILPYTEAINKYISYENMPIHEQMNHIARLDTVINSLKSEIDENPKNWEAHYFYAMALSDKLNGDSDVLDFQKINASNTRRVSKVLEPLINNAELKTAYKHSPQSKMTQIWGNLAVSYVLNGEADSVDYALRSGRKNEGFPVASLEYCRNVLNSLDANAILFVSSPIDLYNFMYLQCEENTRIDVSLVSVDMLMNQWYAKWLNFLPNMTSPTNTNCSDAKLNSIYSVDSTKYKAKNINIGGSSVNVNPQGTNLNNYLYPPFAMMFEIIKHNAVRRPVYFTHSAATYTPGILGINKIIASEGLVFKLLNSASEPILIDKAINNLLNKYKYEELKDAKSQQDIDFKIYYSDYKTAFIQAILFLSKNMPEKEELSALVEKFEEIFPKKTNPRRKDEAGIISQAKEIIKQKEEETAKK